VEGGMDRLSVQIYQVSLNGGPLTPVAVASGFNRGVFGEQHAVLAHAYNLADGSQGVDVLSRDG
jgi:hypothetical protein